MHILIITQYFWPESFRINDLALGLKEKNHTVTILTGKPNYPGGLFYPGYGFFRKRQEQYCGMDVIRIPLVPRGKGRGLRLALNYLSFAFFASLIAPFRCRRDYDIIFVYEPSPITVGLPALLVKRLKKTPMMLWVQDLWPESLSATGAVRSVWVLSLVERLVRFIYRGCDVVLVQSRAFSTPIEKLGVNKNKIVYFPNTAEQLYQPLSIGGNEPEAVGIPDGFRVMFAGNIGAAQDFDTILEAAEMLKTHSDIHWLILGDGRMFRWVEEQVANRGLGDCVHLFGRHPTEAMPRYFALADVMLVILKKDPIFSMTIPAKVQSYLACAKPVIAALEGEGARVVREAGAGLTPAPENPKALAEAALAMYHMSDAERKAMGRRGRSYFERNFDRNMLISRLEHWMADLKKAKKCAY